MPDVGLLVLSSILKHPCVGQIQYQSDDWEVVLAEAA